MNARIARRLFLVVLGVAAIFLAAPGAEAQGGGGGQRVGPAMASHRPPFERAFRFRGRFWDNPRISAALKLTPDQQKAMDDILFQHREKLIDLQANVQKAELNMEPLMNADEPNQAAIEAQIDKVVAARGALEKANSEFLLAIRMKLTPEQWKQIKDLRAEAGMRRDWDHEGMHQRMRSRGEGGQTGGPPPPSTQGPPPAPSGGTDSGTPQ